MNEAAGDRDPFATLLRRLARDGHAQVGYERLRHRLIQFFRLHLPADADDLADMALDRIARRLHEGVEIEHLPAYALGVARLLVLEARTRLAKRQRAERALAADEDDNEAASAAASLEAASSALATCLDQLGAQARALILDYYGADGARRIQARQRLAAELGSSLNALRNRALRLRERLERCVRERWQPDGA